ncbi:MAG TPA: hypothetical protein VK327_00135, partial [Candidatus Paceibacterota bacterium]|nr:hypothetical protein [Candidatus Paceibacterota bacterium]
MNTFVLRCLAVLALAVPAFADQSTHALTPARLRCEYAVDPLGIDIPHPRLFWIVESQARNQQQSAFQILAASSAALLAKNNGDLWDSGKVTSPETIHIRYAGKELKSSQRVFW